MSDGRSQLPPPLRVVARLCWTTLSVLLLCPPVPLSSQTVSAAQPMQQDVYESGSGDYHTYRIPALVVTTEGTLLAFCEGRKSSRSDAGDIDLLVRRSVDGGRTWTPQHVVWDDAQNTCGNPCPIVDRQTGTIWLLMTWNRGDDSESEILAQTSHDTRRVFVTSSQDDGCTWRAPTETTSDVKQPAWTWYATGPGAGIQIENGPHAGRLVAACDHIEAGTKAYYSHVLYSDDHGRSWKLGGRTPKPQVNECQVVELSGGDLMLNMRNYDRTQPCRQTALSSDGGFTWGAQQHAPQLVEPVCQASIRRYRWPTDQSPHGNLPGVVLFSNPASETSRTRLTVRASLDDGRSWPHTGLLHDGPSAYSDLAVLNENTIACLYERGNESPYETITLARFTYDWLTDE